MKKFTGENTILHVYQKIAIWCTFSEVRSETNRNFCHFGLFFALSASDNLENQNFKIEKKNTLTYYHFTHLHHTCQSYDHMIYGPKIWNATDIIFCHSEPFFALLPPYGPRKPKF